jgi:catechol 2,3-dioxygenase
MAAFRLPEDLHLRQVCLRVRDLERMLRFYVDLLGFCKLEQSASGSVALSVDGRAPALIVLTGAPDAPLRPRRTTGLYHFAIRYPTRRDVAHAVRRLLEHRYPIDGASDHAVSEAIYLADPEGNGVELYADRPRAVWPMRGREVVMDTRPLDLESLLKEATGPGAEPPPLGADLGHLHLHVADLGEAEAFFHEFLGLSVMMRIPASATFLSAGGYHHHVAVNTWAGPQPAPSDATGLISYRLETAEPEVLYCLEKRAPLAGLTAERATEDGRALLRIRDPNGHWLELAAT